MPIIGRSLYHQAMVNIIKQNGLRYQEYSIGKILIYKDNRKIFIEMAGKNLPYFGSDGQEAFPWETHLKPKRLDIIEKYAKNNDAESWVSFCYAIFKNKYMKYFCTIITLDDIYFGARLIKTSDYRKYMKPRSPSWSVVDLPRGKVIELTSNLQDI